MLFDFKEKGHPKKVILLLLKRNNGYYSELHEKRNFTHTIKREVFSI